MATDESPFHTLTECVHDYLDKMFPNCTAQLLAEGVCNETDGNNPLHKANTNGLIAIDCRSSEFGTRGPIAYFKGEEGIKMNT